MAKNVVIIGTQWGDEGKGKIVDLITDRVSSVVRFQGGHNAGHTLVINGNKTVLQPGMVFAVDGGASAKDFRSQVGDSFIITIDGYEQITHHSKAIEDLIIK